MGIQEPSPATFTLAFQVTGNPLYAERALKNASTRLMMARRVLRGGREHADMGGAICSVAAGHGRNWGTGSVTGCYGPLILGLKQIQSQMEKKKKREQRKKNNQTKRKRKQDKEKKT